MRKKASLHSKTDDPSPEFIDSIISTAQEKIKADEDINSQLTFVSHWKEKSVFFKQKMKDFEDLGKNKSNINRHFKTNW